MTPEQSDPITGLHANASSSQQVERQHAPLSAALLSEGTDFPRRSHEISLLLKYSPHTFIDLSHRLASSDWVFFPPPLGTLTHIFR